MGSMARSRFRAPSLTAGPILAAQTLGADFAYIGSAFIATAEANAVDAYKQAVVDSTAADIIYSNLFTGRTRQLSARLDRRLGSRPR